MMISFNPDELAGLSPTALAVLLTMRADEQEPFLADGNSTMKAIRNRFGIGQHRAQGALNELRRTGRLRVSDEKTGRRLVTIR